MQSNYTSDSDSNSELNFSGFISEVTESDFKMSKEAKEASAAELKKAEKFFGKLERFVQGAETEIRKAKALIIDEDMKLVSIRAMQSRIKDWIINIKKYKDIAASYTNADGCSYIERSEIVRMDLTEISTAIEELVKVLQADRSKIIIPEVSDAAKIVKTTASEFPKFSENGEFEIWETTWNQLAASS